MALLDAVLLVLAGFCAGALNAVAGGGTFFTFPALLAIGLPPVTASATNAVALWPATLSAAWAGRRSLAPLGRYLWPLLACGIVGGFIGGCLLLLGGDDVFRNLIPWLLLTATLLFAVSPWLSRVVAARRTEPVDCPPHTSWSLASHFGVSIYGGYFGAGIGILQMAAFSIEGHPLNRANALKNLISGVIYTSVSLTFIIAGRVAWFELTILLLSAAAGGYFGGVAGQRLPAQWLRILVLTVGGLMTLYYFYQTYA